MKRLVRLRDRRPRDAARVFLVEGYRAIRRALDSGIVLNEVYYCPDWFLGENEADLLAEAESRGACLFALSKPVFAKCAYRDRPEGLLAVAPQWHHTCDEFDRFVPDGVDPLILVVEAIEKPGNLGTILRSADAAGAHAVVVCDPVTDLFNPNVVRSSTGTLFTMPVIVASGEEARGALKGRGVRLVATTPAAERLHTEADLTGPLALIMGSEQHGLSDPWLREADERVRIPMAGQADSLNVAMATLVTLFEAVRQRGSRGNLRANS